MTCHRCHARIELGSRYCPKCSLSFNSEIDIHDPEITRITEMIAQKAEQYFYQHLKTRWWVLMVSITMLAGISVILGFGPLVPNLVSSEVESHLEEIKDDIRIRRREFDIAIVEADMNKKQLSGERDKLTHELSSLRGKRYKLSEEVEEIRIKRDEIASILGETNFVIALTNCVMIYIELKNKSKNRPLFR